MVDTPPRSKRRAAVYVLQQSCSPRPVMSNEIKGDCYRFKAHVFIFNK
jgi:hypothetical protein